MRIDEQLANAPEGVYMFSVQGKKCHCVSSLLPVETRTPRSAQLQVFDIYMEVHVNMRRSIMDGLDREIVATIRCVLSQENSIEMFLRADEFINQEILNVQLVTHAGPLKSICEHTIAKRVARWSSFYFGAERDILPRRGG